MLVQAPRRLFTVDQFHQMGEAGIFSEDDRVELLAGEIVDMTPIGSRHAACVSRLTHLFAPHLGEAFVLRVQDPVQLDDYSEPQPDLALVKPRGDFYRDAHPRPAEVLLLIEVADTSVEIDRAEKIPLYAASGVPEVWIVDLNAGHVDVYRDPASGGYQTHETVVRGGSLRPAALSQVELSADSLIL
jgi:Uma2 family endonuclease